MNRLPRIHKTICSAALFTVLAGIVSLFLLTDHAAQGADTVPPAGQGVQRIYVPDNATQSWPKGDWTPISGRELQEMLDTVAAPNQPSTMRIASSLYRATLKGNELTGDFQMKIISTGDQDLAFPLTPLNLRLSTLTIDSRPAVWGTGLDQKTYIIVPAGSHTISGNWSTTCSEKLLQRDCLLQFPSAELSQFELTIPRQLDIELLGGIQRSLGKPKDEMQRWQVLVGNRNEARLQIKPSLSEQPVTSSIKRRSLTWTLSPDEATVSDVIEVKVHTGILEQMTFVTDRGLEFENVSLSTGEPLDFTTQIKGGRKRLTVHFPPFSAGSEFIFRLKGTLVNPRWRNWIVPECMPENILWQNHQVTIQLTSPLEYLTCSLNGYQMAGPVDSIDGGQRIVFDKTAQSGSLSLQTITPSFELSLQSRLEGQLSGGGLLYRQVFDVTALSGRVDQLICQVPLRAQILNVRVNNEAVSTLNSEGAYRWQVSSPQDRDQKILRIDIVKPQLSAQGMKIEIDAFYQFARSPWLSSKSNPLQIQPLFRIEQGEVQKQTVRIEHDQAFELALFTNQARSTSLPLPPSQNVFASGGTPLDMSSLRALLPRSLRIPVIASKTIAWEIQDHDENLQLEIWNDQPTQIIIHSSNVVAPLVEHSVQLRTNGLLISSDQLQVELIDAESEPIFTSTTRSGPISLPSRRSLVTPNGHWNYEVDSPPEGWESLTSPILVRFQQLLTNQTRIPRVFLPTLKVDVAHWNVTPLSTTARVKGLQPESQVRSGNTISGIYSREDEVLLESKVVTTQLSDSLNVHAEMSTVISEPNGETSHQTLLHHLKYEFRGLLASPVTIDIPTSYQNVSCLIDGQPWPIDLETHRMIVSPDSSDKTTVELKMSDQIPSHLLWSDFSISLPKLSCALDDINWRIASERNEIFLDPYPLTSMASNASVQYTNLSSPYSSVERDSSALSERTISDNSTTDSHGWLDSDRILRGRQFLIRLDSGVQSQGLSLKSLSVKVAGVSTVIYYSLTAALALLWLGTLVPRIRWILACLSLIALFCLASSTVNTWSPLLPPSVILIATTAILWMIPVFPTSSQRRSTPVHSSTMSAVSTVSSLLIALTWISYSHFPASAAQSVKPQNQELTVLIPYSDATKVTDESNRPPLADEPIVYLDRTALSELRTRSQSLQSTSDILFRKAEYDIDVQLEQTLVFARYEVSMPSNRTIQEISFPFQNVAFSGINGCFVDGRPAGISSSNTRPGIVVTMPGTADSTDLKTAVPPSSRRETHVVEIAFFLKKGQGAGLFVPVQIPYVHQATARRIDHLDFRYLVEMSATKSKPILITDASTLLTNQTELSLKLLDSLPKNLPSTLTITPETLIDLRQNLADVSVSFQVDASQASSPSLMIVYQNKSLPLEVRSAQLLDQQTSISPSGNPETLLNLRFPEAGRYNIATHFLLPLPDKIELGDLADLVTIQVMESSEPVDVKQLYGPVKIQSKLRQNLIVPHDVSTAITNRTGITSPLELSFLSLNKDDTTPISIESSTRQLSFDSLQLTITPQSKQVQLSSVMKLSEINLNCYTIEFLYPDQWNVQQVELIHNEHKQSLSHIHNNGRLYIYLAENAIQNCQLNIVSNSDLAWPQSDLSNPINIPFPQVIGNNFLEKIPIQIQLSLSSGFKATFSPESALTPLTSDLDLIDLPTKYLVTAPRESLSVSFKRPAIEEAKPVKAEFDVEFSSKTDSPESHLDPIEPQTTGSTQVVSNLSYELTSTSDCQFLIGQLAVTGPFETMETLSFRTPSDLATITASANKVPLKIATNGNSTVTVMLPEEKTPNIINISWTIPISDWSHLTMPTPTGKIAKCHIETAFPASIPDDYQIRYPHQESGRLVNSLIQLNRISIPGNHMRHLAWILTGAASLFIVWLTRQAWYPPWNYLRLRGLPLMASGMLLIWLHHIWIGLGLLTLGICCLMLFQMNIRNFSRPVAAD